MGEEDFNCPTTMSKSKPYEEPLSPLACLTAGKLFQSYIFGIVGFKKEIDIEFLKISLQNSLLEHQRFSSVLIRDHKHKNLKWSLREVEINDHVIVPSLDPSFTQNPDFVNEYTASLVTAPPLNQSRPLWEVHVLNAKSGEAAGSLVFRIHHSLGDSVSLLSLLVNYTGKASDPKSMPTIPEYSNKSKSRSDKEISTLFQIAYWWVVGVWFTVLAALDHFATFLWKKDITPLRQVSAISSERQLAYVNIEMNHIREVQKAVNGTVNEVMMGIISAGFVRYLTRRYEKTATTDHARYLPSNSRVRAIVAVNMRRSPLLKDLGKNMKNPAQAMWGNKLGFWLFPLPMVHYEDPLQYCRATTSTSRIKKLSFESSLTSTLAKSLPTKLVEYIANKINTSTTLGFSNVIGPAEEIEFCDNTVTHIIPTASVNHTPIVMHFISYGGKGKLVAMVSEDVVPDPQQLCSDCADALQRINEAAHNISFSADPYSSMVFRGSKLTREQSSLPCRNLEIGQNHQGHSARGC